MLTKKFEILKKLTLSSNSALKTEYSYSIFLALRISSFFFANIELRSTICFVSWILFLSSSVISYLNFYISYDS